MSYRPTLRETLRLRGDTNFDLALVERLLDAIEMRVRPVEDKKASLEAVEQLIRDVALQRINDVLTPAIQSVLLIQERGFLIARSSTSATIAANDVHTFVIADEHERATFVPGPYPALTREGSPDDTAVTRLVDWNAATGELMVEVIAVFGDPGPHSDWVIVATAGVVNAMQAMLDEVRVLSGQVAEDRLAVAGDRLATQTARGEAVAAALAAENAALNAQTWNPANYYPKAETYSKDEIDMALGAKVGPDALTAGNTSFANTSNGFTADNVQAAIEEAAEMATPTGTVIWSAADPGDAYLPCDGLIYLQSAYPALAEEIGQIDAYSTGTQRTAAGSYSGSFQDVIDAGGTLVACGASGGLQTSPDGTTWTQRTAGSAYNGLLRKLLWTGTSIIAVGDGANGIQTSPDGTTWTPRTAGSASRSGIATDGTNIVIVGNSGDIRHSTDDGATWTQRSPGGSYSNNFTGVIYVPSLSLFVAFGLGGEIQTSPTGVTWTQQTADSGFGGAFYAGAVFNDLVVLFGQGGEIQTSADGSTWTRRATGGQQWSAAKVIDGTLFAVGNLSKTGVSKNATDWHIVEGEAGKPRLRVVIQAGDGVFALGDSGAALIGYSPFSVWKAVVAGGGYTLQFNAAVTVGDRIVAVGANGGIQTYDPDYDLDTEFAVPTLDTIGNIVVPYIRT